MIDDFINNKEIPSAVRNLSKKKKKYYIDRIEKKLVEVRYCSGSLGVTSEAYIADLENYFNEVNGTYLVPQEDFEMRKLFLAVKILGLISKNLDGFSDGLLNMSLSNLHERLLFLERVYESTFCVDEDIL
jgi:hypothetical protein